MKLKLWRDDSEPEILIDKTPSGAEEENFLFSEDMHDVTKINRHIAAQNALQDMGERKLFADRAFGLSGLWVCFLCVLPFVQMILSIWGAGLSDGQFIAVVTTTTASVFGFWYLVGRYLFPQKSESKEIEEKPKNNN